MFKNLQFMKKSRYNISNPFLNIFNGNAIIIGVIVILFAMGTSLESKNLFVAPNGDDNVSRSDNNINQPWASPKQAWYNAQPGDSVFFRAGTYIIDSKINTIAHGYDGTAAQPIVFTNYQSEACTLKSTVSTAFYIERNYNYVNGFTCIGKKMFFFVGYDSDATNFKLTNCIGSTSVAGGGDNVGFIKLNSTTANGAIIENNVLTGMGGGANENTAGIFMFRVEGAVVRNNEINNYPGGIYYKHTGVNHDTGMEWAYNVFRDCGWGIMSVASHVHIHNNLFINCSIRFGNGAGLGNSGNNVGADNNNVHHNTFYNKYFFLEYVADGDGSGCQNNRLYDNIFTEESSLHAWSNKPHNSIMDYNLYTDNPAVLEFNQHYSLPAWKSHSGMESHSVTGAANFVGGSNPVQISDFKLANNSIGKNASSDGTDIGANIDLVGASVTFNPPPPNTAPSTPQIIQVGN